jgi:hypothetical protein
MRIKQISEDFPEEVIKAFAQFLGWSPKVSKKNEDGTIESDEENKPIIIDNPVTYADFFKERYNALPLSDLKAFNLAQIRAEKEAELKEAETQVEEHIKSLVNVTVE